MRSLSSLALAAGNAAQTGEVVVVLLTITHPTLGTPIRVCSDSVECVSRGNTFLPFPFECNMPRESDDAPQAVTLRICAVDRSVISAARTAVGGVLTAAMEVVYASTPNVVECGPYNFTIRRATYDAMVLEGELSFEDVLNAKFPKDIFSPALFTNLL